MHWVCQICGYVHDEEECPEMCPVCGAPKSRFEKWVEEDSSKLIDDTQLEENDDLYEDYEV
jgi:rubredoxin